VQFNLLNKKPKLRNPD